MQVLTPFALPCLWQLSCQPVIESVTNGSSGSPPNPSDLPPGFSLFCQFCNVFAKRDPATFGCSIDSSVSELGRVLGRAATSIRHPNEGRDLPFIRDISSEVLSALWSPPPPGQLVRFMESVTMIDHKLHRRFSKLPRRRLSLKCLSDFPPPRSITARRVSIRYTIGYSECAQCHPCCPLSPFLQARSHSHPPLLGSHRLRMHRKAVTYSTTPSDPVPYLNAPPTSPVAMTSSVSSSVPAIRTIPAVSIPPPSLVLINRYRPYPLN